MVLSLNLANFIPDLEGLSTQISMFFGQSSFRRILLSRLLLVSVPVLLIGVYVTYRKARSAFLETARQNLTESAVRKGESIHQSIEALQATLVTASDSVVLKLGSSRDKQSFVEQLATKLPTNIQCVQLIDLQTKKITASTCGFEQIDSFNSSLWAKRQKHLLTNPNSIDIKNLIPSASTHITNNTNQLELLLSVPVYNIQGQLQYSLSIKSALLQMEILNPGSLSGYPVVINQQGVILAHPFPEKVGNNITQESDSDRLHAIIKAAAAGKEDFLHLFSFEKDGIELVTGYSAIASPISQEKEQKWIILAVTTLDAALTPLKDIQKVLLSMVITLIIVSGLVILYIAWELGRPLEKLRDYALNMNNLSSQTPIPHSFHIREFNQLAMATQDMMERLTSWGEEMVSAWQEAKTANQLKSEFLATTSHELRTPLNGIIGCIRIVKDGYCDSPAEEKDFLEQADQAAIYLLGIINDILDIAKIEAGKLSISLEPVNVEQIISEVIALQTVIIQQKNLTINFTNNLGVIIVYADREKLKQVLVNVIGNAIKFTEYGEININISMINYQLDDPNESRVIITIKDTGIGIDPKQQDKLFRPFVMIDGSTTRKFSGTGLGLAISKNLIELMGGKINLLSLGENQGTTVKIILPLVEISQHLIVTN
jgi:signal transduction histidine kinase